VGSLNSDGSRISQARHAIRKIGGAEILSQDRAEAEVIREQSPEEASDTLGSNANLSTSQYSTVSSSQVQKVTTPAGDDVVERVREVVSATPTETQSSDLATALAAVASVGGGGGGGGWTDGDGVVTTTTVADGVGIGDGAPAANSKFEVSCDSTRTSVQISLGSGGSFSVEGGFTTLDDGLAVGAGAALDSTDMLEVVGNSTRKDVVLQGGEAGMVYLTSSDGSSELQVTDTSCSFSAGTELSLSSNDGALSLSSTEEMTLTAGASSPVVIGSNRLAFSSTAGVMILTGAATPESSISAPPGSLYIKTNAPVSIFMKMSGTGNTGWEAVLVADSIDHADMATGLVFDPSTFSIALVAPPTVGGVNGGTISVVAGAGGEGGSPGDINLFPGSGGGVIRLATTTGPILHSGTGSPESVVTAPVGSMYLRTDGGSGTTFYVKETGTGNTGWAAK
jgi:hypothetical protein